MIIFCLQQFKLLENESGGPGRIIETFDPSKTMAKLRVLQVFLLEFTRTFSFYEKEKWSVLNRRPPAFTLEANLRSAAL